MEKKAIISIKSFSEMDESAKDGIEVVTPGKIIINGDEIKAIYEESKISGMEGTTTYITVSGNSFIMERVGTTSTKMEFVQGEGNYALYNTPYGMLDLHIDTKVLNLNVNENGGEIYCKYILSAQGQDGIVTELNIKIKA